MLKGMNFKTILYSFLLRAGRKKDIAWKRMNGKVVITAIEMAELIARLTYWNGEVKTMFMPCSLRNFRTKRMIFS